MKGDHVSNSPRLIAGGDAADNALEFGKQSAASAPTPDPVSSPKIMVWDIAVRVFHWST